MKIKNIIKLGVNPHEFCFLKQNGHGVLESKKLYSKKLAWVFLCRRLHGVDIHIQEAGGDPDTIIRLGNYFVVCGLCIEHYVYFINCIQNLNVSI